MKQCLPCLIHGKIRHTPCNWKVCQKHWQKFCKTLAKKLKAGWSKDECCPKCGKGTWIISMLRL